MATWAKILLALVLFLALLAGAGLAYVYSGAYNVAATADHSDLVRWVLETTQARSVRAHADAVTLTVPADSVSLRRGFQAYEQMCVVCHGAPGQERGWMGQGMTPTPPDLGYAAEEFSPEEIHWILRHGIKMAGMPALSPTHSEEEILELTAFVMQLPDMTEADYQASRPQEQPDAPSASDHDGHDHTH